jgi:hypothetical protein
MMQVLLLGGWLARTGLLAGDALHGDEYMGLSDQIWMIADAPNRISHKVLDPNV